MIQIYFYNNDDTNIILIIQICIMIQIFNIYLHTNLKKCDMNKLKVLKYLKMPLDFNNNFMFKVIKLHIFLIS